MRYLPWIVAAWPFIQDARAEWFPAGGAMRVRENLERLQRLGSVLMIAAHPDDENTALLAYWAKGRHLRTGYLSMTRGEGGQNLIGSEQGELLGIIRTEELLAARRIDGAEQFFTRAIDFGFSKSAGETLGKWGREQALSDVVWVIRGFQPDVIVTRFSGTPRDGHGHHQSSAILAREAFSAAADRGRFPEQLKYVDAWQARRLYWNLFVFGPAMEKEAATMANRLAVDTGEYSAVLGASYSELAGASRSQHRSQGMGSIERRGSAMSYLVPIAGEPAAKDLFEGIDTSWSGRAPGGAAVGALIGKAARELAMDAPERVIPNLIEARRAMASLKGAWIERKRAELDETIVEAAGLWLDASSAKPAVTPGSEMGVTASVVLRSRTPVRWLGFTLEGTGTPEMGTFAEEDLVFNQPKTRAFRIRVPADQPFSQPFWLRRAGSDAVYRIEDPREIGPAGNAPLMRARFRLSVSGEELEIEREVANRYVDPVKGEQVRPVAVAPAVAVEFGERAMVFAGGSPRKVEVRLRANVAAAEGDVALETPVGWKAEPATRAFRLSGEGEMTAASFLVTPPGTAGKAELGVVARVGGIEIRHGMRAIEYDHIRPRTVFPAARAVVVRAEARTLARRVGYVMGAGDEVPQALRQLGVEVSLLGEADLAQGGLGGFDAIVTGVRAYNVRKDLRANQHRLLDWVAAGGTLVVQYNVLEGGFRGENPRQFEKLGPFPIQIGRERVTVEDAAMRPVRADHPLLAAPNRIGPGDYEGWVQERGLYFASRWSPGYEPIWETGDPGEKPALGGTLYARHGKGVYIFTALAWFRQLPAGVPGAYRIFANFLSAGKVGNQ